MLALNPVLGIILNIFRKRSLRSLWSTTRPSSTTTLGTLPTLWCASSSTLSCSLHSSRWPTTSSARSSDGGSYCSAFNSQNFGPKEKYCQYLNSKFCSGMVGRHLSITTSTVRRRGGVLSWDWSNHHHFKQSHFQDQDYGIYYEKTKTYMSIGFYGNILKSSETRCAEFFPQ